MDWKTQKIKISSIIMMLFMAMFACSSTRKSNSNIEFQRDLIRATAQQTLVDLYKNDPATRNAVANAAGYAIFSDFGLKMKVRKGVVGKGIAVLTASKQETFMKMMEPQDGLGVGERNYRLVLIFESTESFNEFVTSGYEFEPLITTEENSDLIVYDEIRAISLPENMKVYQLSNTGATVEVSITGAKCSKDEGLNLN
jgi:hypothetical protein